MVIREQLLHSIHGQVCPFLPFKPTFSSRESLITLKHLIPGTQLANFARSSVYLSDPSVLKPDPSLTRKNPLPCVKGSTSGVPRVVLSLKFPWGGILVFGRIKSRGQFCFSYTRTCFVLSKLRLVFELSLHSSLK